MNLWSPAFETNQFIPQKYTCDGDNISPPLQFSEIPLHAESLVIIVEDPDALSKAYFTHWLLYNIPPSVLTIEENQIPSGSLQGVNDFGAPTYGGPCPPSGTHRYFFRLYALDLTLEISKDINKDTLQNLMIGHILDSAELIGLYSKKNLTSAL